MPVRCESTVSAFGLDRLLDGREAAKAFASPQWCTEYPTLLSLVEKVFHQFVSPDSFALLMTCAG